LSGEARSCHADSVPGRDRDSEELRAVAPLVAVVGDSQQLVGPITLVKNAGKTLGITSAEILRAHQGAQFRVLTELDGSKHVDVTNIGMGRYAGIALVELARAIPDDADVKPLGLGGVNATTDTRGAPAGILSINPIAGGRFERMLIPVYVDNDDGGGMLDRATRIVSPMESAHAELDIEGAPLFAWFPPNPALGRPGEVLAVGIAYPYRAQTAKPRDLPVLAQLVGLDDLGRALIAADAHEQRPELKQVVSGEIEEKLHGEPDPLAGLDD
jgi:hypothetical protein